VASEESNQFSVFSDQSRKKVVSRVKWLRHHAICGNQRSGTP